MEYIRQIGRKLKFLIKEHESELELDFWREEGSKRKIVILTLVKKKSPLDTNSIKFFEN